MVVTSEIGTDINRCSRGALLKRGVAKSRRKSLKLRCPEKSVPKPTMNDYLWNDCAVQGAIALFKCRSRYGLLQLTDW